MIRHSSSFFISLVIHSILLVLVIITYKTYYSTKKEVCETRICVELRALDAKEEVKKTIPKPKKIKKKPKKRNKEKKKIKKKDKEQKHIRKVLTVPVVQQIPEPKIVEQEAVVETTSEVKEIKKVEPVLLKPKEKSPQEIENERRIKQEHITKEYVNLNTQKISELLRENLYYPRSARKRGITGKIVVKFRLKTDAVIDNIIVVKSKSDILSRAAIKTIQNLSGEFPKPQEDITLHVPIGYTLR